MARSHSFCPEVKPAPPKHQSKYACLPRGKLHRIEQCRCGGARLICRQHPKVYSCRDRRLNTNCQCCTQF